MHSVAAAREVLKGGLKLSHDRIQMRGRSSARDRSGAHVAACGTLSTLSTAESTDPIAAHRSAKASDKGKTERASRSSCCKRHDRGAREHPPRTNDYAVAQDHVVLLEVPEESPTKR